SVPGAATSRSPSSTTRPGKYAWPWPDWLSSNRSAQLLSLSTSPISRERRWPPAVDVVSKNGLPYCAAESIRGVRIVGVSGRGVAAPHPDERVGERRAADVALAVAGLLTEKESVVVALCHERGGGALVGHDPVVVAAFRRAGAEVGIVHVEEHPQRL